MTGALTVGDVVAAGARIGSLDGHAVLVELWARSVWDAWGGQVAYDGQPGDRLEELRPAVDDVDEWHDGAAVRSHQVTR